MGNLSSSGKNFDNGKASVNRLTSNKRSSYSNGDRNYGSSNDKSRDRYSNDSRDKYNNNGSRNGSRNNSRERYRQPSVDRHRSNEVDASCSRHMSPDYRGSSSNEIVCYYCHRPGHIAMDCPDIRCYACGRWGHTAFSCDVNRPRRDSGGHNGRYSPGRGSSQNNEEKSSAVRFNNISRVYDSGNGLKQRIRVNGTYVDFMLDTGAEVSIVTEATVRNLNLALEKSDRVLSGADDSPLSVLGKSEVFLENKLKFVKTTVYVIKGLQCNLLGLKELMKLGLLAVENNTCRIECHHHGHRVKDCPKKAKSGSAEHPLEECPKGGKSFSGGTERSSAEAPSVIPPMRSSTAAPAATVTNSSSSDFSYVSRLARSTVETTTSMAIGSFLNNFEGYGNQDFESQLRRVDELVKEERIRSERRIAELAAKRKEIVKNQRNAVKLSNLLAQLKEVQQELDDSSNEMDQSAPCSSSTVPSSNVETVSNVDINVKVEKGIDRDGDGVSKVVLVERVDQASTDSGGSVAGTHPVSAVTDTAGVSDIGSSAVPGGSVAGIHPVSAAAGGSDRMVDAAGMLGNSSHRTSSGTSPDRNSQSSKLNVEETEVMDHLNWFDETEPK